MAHRIDVDKVAPGGVRAMLGLEDYVRSSGLGPSLLELAKLRASQMNALAGQSAAMCYADGMRSD